jgi:Protein of unknown function (DUF1345)
VPAIGDDDVHPTATAGRGDGQRTPENPDNAHVLNGIRSLHERIDELQHVVAQRLDADGIRVPPMLHAHPAAEHHPRQLPAWCRPTQGEARWQVAICTAVAIALQIAVPGRLVLLSPVWALPALQGALLVSLIVANPHRINRESRALRLLSLTLAALMTFANVWTVERLAVGLVDGRQHWNAGQLLITGGAIWLTNVIVFALWYWEFDRGGPVARALATKPYPDFQFPQMVTPEMAPPQWEPAFTDYLYLAFTNASAFSPTDVMPLSRWAKMAMTVQSMISIVTVALVVARAVNILQ